MNKIYLLPRFETNMADEAHLRIEREREKTAESMNYIPATLEELRAIDHKDVWCMIGWNKPFFDAMMNLCKDLIDEMFSWHKQLARDGVFDCPALESAITFEDMLNSGFYGENYNDSFESFLELLVEDYLFEDSSENPIV